MFSSGDGGGRRRTLMLCPSYWASEVGVARREQLPPGGLWGLDHPVADPPRVIRVVVGLLDQQVATILHIGCSFLFCVLSSHDARPGGKPRWP